MEKWQVEYRHWWGYRSNLRLAPLARQVDDRQIEALLDEK
jgi:hypothetical protein